MSLFVSRVPSVSSPPPLVGGVGGGVGDTETTAVLDCYAGYPAAGYCGDSLDTGEFIY